MSNINNATPDRSSVAGQTADQLRDRAGDAADALKGVGAKASATAQDAGDKASELLGQAKDTAKDKVSDASGKVADALEDRKSAGAERVKGISAAIRRAADELEHELPPAATYIRRAADEIDGMADAVQRRDVRQILGDIQGFARRQPAAFLGATVLGGFAVMRLLKAPASDAAAGGSSHSASSAGGTSLVPVGGPTTLGDVSATGGSGDPGGIAPVAPGFGPGSANIGTGANRS